MEDLKTLVVQLASARRCYDQDKEVMDKLEADFRRDHEALLLSMERVKTLRDDLEGEIRLRTYSTDNRTPAPGLTVKVVTKMSYFPDDATTWAIEHRHYKLLTINARAFEKVAGGLRPEFVTITEVPSVTIARDLTEAAAQIGAEKAAEVELEAQSQVLRAAGYGPCTEALVGTQDVSGFFDKAAKAVTT